MSEIFALPRGEIICWLDVQAGAISGTGSPYLPMLLIPLQLRLRCPRGVGSSIDFREFRCRVSAFDGAYIAESRPAVLDLRIKSETEVPNHLVYLEIPLDRVRLAVINRLREGGDVKLRLDLELKADELMELGHRSQTPDLSVWGLSAHHRPHAQVQTVITRSHWVERILSGTGFGKVHMVELPAVPIELCAGFKSSFEALQQAHKLESQGFYRQAVGKCRVALEPFFEIVEKVDEKGGKLSVPTLKASWQSRLGKATYEWLNSALGALRGRANQAVHLSSETFQQLEAELFLAVTTAVLAYAIKTQPERPEEFIGH